MGDQEKWHPSIESALTTLIENDLYLLENEVNERSQTHKLAEYLQRILPKWNVDCEYNRKLEDPKTLNFDENIVNNVKNIMDRLKKQLENKNNNKINEDGVEALSLSQEGGAKYIKNVFPDIIVHKRGIMENKIVIEAKKENNTKEEARLFDLIKLALFTDIEREYGYEAGYFIDIPKFETLPEKFSINFKRDETLKHIKSNVWIVEVGMITNN